ncbi:MAG: hypothetical protein A3J40_02550 [Erythrobacter sp. RIFCSPHIGHO2_12_FULL_63_10]|nr:MAG: hypothetical protein A3J40_02550 [Erythrobacter sp. RIFCSPHIGHO2_12_FULL_63_10]
MVGKNPAYKRYVRRMAVLAIVYIGAVVLSSSLIPDDAPPDPLNIAIALVPGFAVLGVIWAMGRLLIELDDEYLRMLEVRKFIVATGLALAVASVWGLLELMTTVPKLPVFYIFPLWCIGLAVGAVFNKLTLGDAGCA